MRTSDEQYIKLLISEGFIRNQDQVVRKTQGARHASHDGDKLHEAAERIFAEQKECSAVVLSTAPGVSAYSKTGKKLPAVLDDLAQLAGQALDCLRNLDEVRGKKAAKSAVMVEGLGCLCAAQNLYEAHALAMVTEKAALAYIGAAVLGRVRVISWIEAWLMRLIYLKKYSRQGMINSARKK